MNVFNRALVGLLALGWCALLGASLLLVWDAGRVVDITNSAMELRFDVSLADQSDRVLATIGVGILITLGLILFAMQLIPHRGHTVARDERRLTDMQKRVDALQHKLDNERTIERKETSREVPVRAGNTLTEKTSVVREDRRPRRWRFLPGR